jgi:hypothetical protein
VALLTTSSGMYQKQSRTLHDRVPRGDQGLLSRPTSVGASR